MMYEDDIFDIDGDGNLLDIPESVRAARRASSHPQGRLGSDSAASGRVRREHEEAAGHILPILDGDGDFGMFNYGDDDMALPDAEAFPAGGVYMSGALQGNDKSLHGNLADRVHSPAPSSDLLSSISADAPLRKKRKTKSKKLASDQLVELRNGDLIAFRDNYVANMAAASQVKINHKAGLQAKKNALHYVYGNGLLGVGDGLGFMKLASPLNMFAGENLLSLITGNTIVSPVKRSKRDREEEQEQNQESSKRARLEEDEVGRGHGLENDDHVFDFGGDDFNHDASSSGVEIGRDAQSALPDLPSSALMPWNVSASLRGSNKGATSLASKRLMSASPLIGRGSALPDQFLDVDDEIMYGRDDELSQSAGVGRAPSSSHAHGFESQDASRAGAEDDFELFGRTANVDTQTAGTSQWVRQALDRESNNFFDYVRNTIEEKTPDELGDDDDGSHAREGEGEGIAGRDARTVTFQELFDEERNSAMVAAQAFYHVLCLATKHRVWVVQDEGAGDDILGGEIRIGVF